MSFAQQPRARRDRTGGKAPHHAGLQDSRRLAAVRRLVSLCPPPSAQFDRIARLAAHLLEAPIALVTLVDDDSQFFVGSHGLEEPVRSAGQTPLDYSICQYVVASRQPMVVPDTSCETVLEGHRGVAEFGFRAYAGIPVDTPDGRAVGATCVLDFVPRNWTDADLAGLTDLAALAADEIRLAELERRAELEREWRGVPRS